MADEQVNIVITAIDDVSKQLDNIKKNISTMTKESTKQTSSLANAFDKTQGSLLVLGSAAERVDSIFDSYDNMMLRVENSSIRVEEATKNVRDAQYALNKVSKDANATAEDLAKAQDDLATANNRVTVAENNLARTNNAITGTYIQMGMSVVTLVASIPSLVSGLAATASALTGVQIAAGPVAWALLAIGAAVAAGVVIYNDYKSKQEEVTKTSDDYRAAVERVKAATMALGTETKISTEQIQKMKDAMSGKIEYKSTEELKLLQEIEQKKLDIANADNPQNQQKVKDEALGYIKQGMDAEDAFRIANANSAKAVMEKELADLEDKHKREYELKRNAAQATNELDARNLAIKQGNFKSEEEFAKLSYTEQLKYLKEYYLKQENDALLFAANEKIRIAQDETNKLVALYNRQAEARANANRGGTQQFQPIQVGTVQPSNTGGFVMNGEAYSMPTISKPSMPLPPNFKPIPLNSNASNATIVFNNYGNNYGVNSDDIASSLDDKLKGLIRG